MARSPRPSDYARTTAALFGPLFRMYSASIETGPWGRILDLAPYAPSWDEETEGPLERLRFDHAGRQTAGRSIA